MFALYAGATYDLIKLGPADIYGGAMLGLTMNRSKFEAFNMTVPENDVNGLVGAVAGARGPAGPLAWSFELGWRETAHDLGDSGDFGESTMSGFVVTVGLGFVR